MGDITQERLGFLKKGQDQGVGQEVVVRKRKEVEISMMKARVIKAIDIVESLDQETVI